MWPFATRNHRRATFTIARRVPRRPILEYLEDRTLSSTSLVTNTFDSGPGSLRQAILDANADATATPATPHLIQFAIPASDPGHVYYGANGITTTTATDDSTIPDLASAWPGGPIAPHSWWLIQPASALPGISVPVVIDGYSQPGASANTLGIGPLSQGHQYGDGDKAVLCIELDGTIANVNNSAFGLAISAGSSTVQGLAINDFSSAIYTYGQGGNTIQGDFIGTDISGTLAKGNVQAGLEIESDGNTIGGCTPAARNIVSGTRQHFGTNAGGNGVFISASNNLVEGNFLGTDATGTRSLANDQAGVWIGVAGSTGNVIGGTTPDARNLISGNGGGGILIDQGAAQNQVEGNFIGTDVRGTVGLGNAVVANNLRDTGVWITSTAGNGNVIGGASYLSNGQQQIAIGMGQPANLAGYYLAGAGNLISGQQVGGNVFGILIHGSGDQVYGNFIGTDVTGMASIGNSTGVRVVGSSNTIGGANGLGNLISGNSTGTGVLLGNQPGTSNVVQGNLIGTDVSGTHALGNNRGMEVDLANNTIGGTSPGLGNVISGNGNEGMIVGASGNIIEGNLIGTDWTGTRPLGNGGPGIRVEASNTLVGGTISAAGNTIAFNGVDGGVSIDQGNGNTIRGNSIHDNAGPGIRLNSATNANNGQASPVLTAVSISSNGTTVMGTLHSVPNTYFDLEFFSNLSTDPAAGRTFLGVLHNLLTDANGNASFTATVAAPPSGQGFVTATATNLATGDTSPFSAPFVFSSLSGLVFEDFNNDGQVDFGEQGIPGVSIHLTGTDVRGNAVNLSQTTDADGAYVFLNLVPGSYTISETQPAGYLQGIDSVGTAGGALVATDQFVVQLGPGVNGLNYNYGEQSQAGGAVQAGQTATIGFWNNRNGQALILALNGGVGHQLGDWLAATFPHLFGAQSASNLCGHSNADVAALFQSDFLLKGVKLDAQVLATALSVYVTNATLDATDVAARYGFIVSGAGVGTATVNVGSNGAAFGVANNTTMRVLDLLFATDVQAMGGVLYHGDGTLWDEANAVYSAVNQGGDIG